MTPPVGRPFRAGTRIAAAYVLAVAFWLAMDAALLACPVCFQAEDGPVASGVRAAVLVLLGVTTAVLSGFALFIVSLVRRTR